MKHCLQLLIRVTGYCHSIDGSTLFSKVVSNKLLGNIKNEIPLIYAKFGADLVNDSNTFFYPRPSISPVTICFLIFFYFFKIFSFFSVCARLNWQLACQFF